jgi:hypothetical protein
LEQALPPIPFLAIIGKASFCHIERRKTNREEKEGAIIAVLADGGVGGEAYSFFIKNPVLYSTYLLCLLPFYKLKRNRIGRTFWRTIF